MFRAEHNDYPIEPDPAEQPRLVDAPLNPLLSKIRRVLSFQGPYTEQHVYIFTPNVEGVEEWEQGQFRWMFGHRLNAQERIDLVRRKTMELEIIKRNFDDDPEILEKWQEIPD